MKYHNKHIISIEYLRNDQLTSIEFRKYFNEKCKFRDNSAKINEYYLNHKKFISDRSLSEISLWKPDSALLNSKTVSLFH